MNAHPAYTVAAGLVCLIFAGLIWLPGRERWPRTAVLLVIAGVGSLLTTVAGHWAREGVMWTESQINRGLGQLFGVSLAWAVALIAIALVGFHLHHRTVSRSTLAYAAAVPLTVTLVPGVLGEVLSFMVGALTWGAGWLFYLAFHRI